MAAQFPDEAPRLPQRRPSLRSVLTPPDRIAPPAPLLRPPVASEEGLIESLRKLWRWRRIIAIFAVALGALSAFVAWSLPSYYVAEARLLVGVNVPRVFNAEAVITDVNPDAERVANEGFILQSRTLAHQVIDKLKLADDPEFNPALREPPFWAKLFEPERYLPSGAVEFLRGLRAPSAKPASAEQEAAQRDNRLIDALLSRVDVSLLGRSHILSVKVDSQNPETAAKIANALVQNYLDHQRREKITSMDKVDKFLISRVSELREQVRKSDQAVEEYRRSHGLYKSSSSGVAAQQLTELNSQLIAAQAAKAQADARLQEAQEMSKGGLGNESVPEVLNSPLIAALKQQEAQAERKLADLSATFGPKYPAMINAKSEVANAQGKVAAEIAKIVDGLAREARAASVRYEALQENFERLKSQMGEVNEQSIQLEALERDATVNHKLLEAMLNRVKQSSGADEILQASARQISPAAPPEAPSYPPKTLIAFLGTFAGLLLGSAVALMRENGDRTFRRADQIEAISGLPVLAMVPQVSGRTPPSMQVLRHPTSPYSESLRRLQIGIELSEAVASPRTILLSSATPSEGKSVMVASLGRLLASNGKRVLLIDCDWRSPALHQIFHCHNKAGLAGLLTERAEVMLDDIIYHDALSGVDVLPAGNWSPRAAHQLSSPRMRQLLDALVPHYDFIILDTAPALVTADVLTLARVVEKVVFVVRWGHTRQDAAIEALKQIVDAQGDVVGVALSRVISQKYRQYGYRDPFYEYSRPARASFG
jgi:polysaccharide biosynthesis transport protein